MHKFLSMLAESGRELKKVKVMTFCAMLAALAVVLSYVSSINIGPYIRIGFSNIPNQLVDLFFGPTTGALFGAILDVLKYLIRPDGAFFFGFTFDAMLAAFIYGCFYYKRPLELWRVLAADGLVALIVNVGLATYWLSVLYGQGFMALLPARALKNVIMWPIESIIYYVLARALQRTGVFNDFLVFKPEKDKKSEKRQPA
ncbi:MAG: folate family ECF transporter S component [Lachnospiraceae bacterium]|nr:folate family ECF transporter S component [Lachnospiraceae bacterium]